jgi:hypothetical protein
MRKSKILARTILLAIIGLITITAYFIDAIAIGVTSER